MKYCKKLLSVLLSLVLCGSMVAPAFAAVSFTDLNNAINADFSGNQQGEKPSGTELEDGGYGYGDQNQDTQKYEIEAWDQDGTRYVEVNTDISYDATRDEGLDSHIYVGGGKDVTLNLGDHTITGAEGDYVIEVAGGVNADPDEQPSPPGDLTIIGGTISHESPADDGDNSGESGSNQPGDNETDNAGQKESGGIRVRKNAHLTLDGTEVTGNAASKGGGIYAEPGAEIELTNGAKVSENKGDDVYLDYGSTDYYNDSPDEKGGAKLKAPGDVTWTHGSSEYTGEVEPDQTGLSLTWKPTNSSGSGGSSGISNEVELDDPDVPLAEGPISCAEFVYKLWLLDGEPAPLDDRGLPATVGEDHEFAEAIAWAVSADVVSVETFDPEELLTVGLAREFLTSFAAYADMVMPELTTLIGEDDDLVLNADDALAEFFGRELDV